jgi:UDP-N-acetylmuramoyl-tripeptide--D-alanyl-D-alanine ligase
MTRKIIEFILKVSVIISLRINNYRIVVVTGSAGKTSAKKAITLVLKKKYKVLSFEDEGYNTELGLPLVVLGRKIPKSKFHWIILAIGAPFLALSKKEYQYLVLEMAADKPGDISYLTSFIKPNIALVTNIFPVHTLSFKNTNNIAKEKSNVFKMLGAGDKAIINNDDLLVRRMLVPGEAKKIVFGRGEGDVIVISQEISKNQTMNIFDSKEMGRMKIKAGSFGDHILYAFAAAIAIGISEGIPKEDIILALESYKNVPGRMNLISGIRGSIILMTLIMLIRLQCGWHSIH